MQMVLIFYHIYILVKYTTLYKSSLKTGLAQDTISIISCNVYQFNKEFDRFQKIIHHYSPDIFVTMESNEDWEERTKFWKKIIRIL